MKKQLIMTLALALASLAASAYDFDFKVDGICYNIISTYQVEVAYPEGASEYSGDIVIPSRVKYKGEEYVVAKIGTAAFYRSEVTSIVLPKTVKMLGLERCFSECQQLKAINLPEGITEIPFGCFMNCKSLETIELPSTMETVGSNCFFDSGLKSIELPEGVQTIEDMAFGGCGSLKEVKLPKSLKTIGGAAFVGSGLESFDFNSLKGVMIGESLFADTKFKSLYIPGGIKFRGGDFSQCYDLTTVTFADDATTVTKNMFGFFCGKLTTVHLGKGMAKIGAEAFPAELKTVYCDAPEPPTIASNSFLADPSEITVFLPSAEAEEKYRAADVWKKMTFVNMGNVADVKVTAPGELSFDLLEQCEMMPAKVVSLVVHGKINEDDFTQMRVNMKALMSLDLSDADITEIPDGAFDGKSTLFDIKLPRKLERIGDRAFNDCNKLNVALPLPAGLKRIGEYAFCNVPLNCELALPEGLEKIGSFAFNNSDLYGSLVIPDGVDELGGWTFADNGISSITLPTKSLKHLGQGVFAGCRSLEEVYIPDNITEMEAYVFQGSSSLRQLRLSPNTSYILDAAFQGTALTSISFPDGVTEILRGMMEDCTSLVSATIPAGVTDIREGAFRNCTNLRALSVKAEVPPTVQDASVFRGVNTDLCIISIPTDSYRKYVLSEYWGQFVQLRYDIAIETEGDGTLGYEGVGNVSSAAPAAYYAPTRAAGVLTRAAEGSAAATADNGTSVYVPKDGKVRFVFTPAEGLGVEQVIYNGEDVTMQVKNRTFTATADRKNGTLKVKFGIETAIRDIAPAAAGAAAYNLDGQQVGTDYRGIVIRNGRKALQR